MDTFPIIVVGGLLIIVGLLVLLARLYPGTGADLLDWGPTRSYEHEVELEMQDVEQMIEAQNAYRRKRGEREITEDEFREDVVRDEIGGSPTASERLLPAAVARPPGRGPLPGSRRRAGSRLASRNSRIAAVTRPGSSSCG